MEKIQSCPNRARQDSFVLGMSRLVPNSAWAWEQFTEVDGNASNALSKAKNGKHGMSFENSEMAFVQCDQENMADRC